MAEELEIPEIDNQEEQAPNGGDPLEQYYNYLKKAGADAPNTFDSFRRTLQNPESAKTYYNYLKTNRFDVPDTYDSFYKTLNSTPRFDYKQPIIQPQQNIAKESTNINTNVPRSVPHETVLDEFANKYQKAKEVLHSELIQNNDLIPDLIKKQKSQAAQVNRLDQLAQHPRSDMPLTGTQQMAERLQPTIPTPVEVSGQEVQDYATLAQKDQSAGRAFLQHVAERKPEKAKQIQQATYLHDAMQRIQEDPVAAQKLGKILSNAKAIEKGQLHYNAQNGLLTKPEGVWESIGTGLKEKNKAFDDYDIFTNSTPDRAIQELEKRRSEHDVDNPISVPEGAIASLAEGASSQPIKGLIAGKVAGAGTAMIPGGAEFAPAVDKFISAAVSSNDFRKMTYARSLQTTYNRLRNDGMSPEDAYKKANGEAKDEAMVDAIAGGAMMYGAGAISDIQLPKFNLSEGFTDAIKNGLKQGAKGVGEAGAVGLIQGGAEEAKNRLAEAKGIERNGDIGEAVKNGTLFTLGIALLAKGGTSLSGKIRTSILQGLSKAKPEQIDAELGNQILEKHITPHEAVNAKKEIDEHKKLDESIPENVTDEARIKIQDKIKKREDLEGQLESSDKAFHPEIKEKIKGINEDILTLSKNKIPKGKQEENKVLPAESNEISETKDVKENLSVGDMIISKYTNGPQKIRNISDDGQFVYIEGADHHMHEIPIEDVTLKVKQGDKKIIHKEIENKFSNDLAENYEQRKEEYVSRFGKVVNTDNVRELSEDYRKNRNELSSAVHEPASDFSKKIYSDLLEEEPESNYVLFTAGGSGSGKTTSLENIPELKKISDHADVVYDGNLNNFNSSINKIDQALATGRDVNIVLTYREIVDAFENGVIPRMKRTGRSVPLEEHVNTHAQVIDNVRQIEKYYKDNPKVHVEYIDNSLGEGSARRSSFEELEKKAYISPDIREKLYESATKKYNRGEISQSEYEGLVGSEQERTSTNVSKGTGRSSRSNDGGQSEQPTEPQQVDLASAKESNPEMTGISHAKTDEAARQFGLDTYETNPETVAEWDQEANRRLSKDPQAISKLLNKLKNDQYPDKIEQRMMMRYMASLKARIEENPTPELISQYKEAKTLSDIVGGREVSKSLAARRGETPTVDSLADYMTQDMESAGVDELTPEQIQKNTEEYNAIKEKQTEYEKKIEDLEKENTKLRAEAQIKNSKKGATKGVKKTHDQYVKERSDILKEAREALLKAAKGDGGLTSSIPGAAQLTAIAPHVAKLIKSLVEEGVDKLEDLVKSIHEDLKGVVDGISEKDVHDLIAGKYNEKKESKNSLQARIRDLRYEAKLINDLESLQKEEKPEGKKQVQQNQKIKDLKDKISELRKKLPRDEKDLTKIKDKNEKEIKEIKEKIAKGDFGPDEKKKPWYEDEDLQRKYPEQFKAAIKAADDLISVKKERAMRLAKQEYENRSGGQKFVDGLKQVFGLRRAINTAFDFSVPFRQASRVTMNPLQAKTTARAFKTMFSHTFSPKAFDRWFFNLEQSPDYLNMQKDKLYISSPDELRPSKKEEQFQSDLAGKIPLLKEPFNASQRAASAYLNQMRVDLYRSGTKILNDKGITRESNPDAYASLAKLANNLTGRGNLLEWLEGKPASALSQVFYGPRLMASKFNLLNPVFYAKMPKPLRINALANMAGYVSFYTSIGMLANAAGASVSLDPSDPDFLKIKVGDTKYDITGGEAVYVRTFLRVMGAAVDRINGTKEEEAQSVKKASGSVLSFFRNKLAPNTSYALNAFLGKNSVGQPFNPTEALKYYPMWIDDIVDDWNQHGAGSILAAGIPSIFGMGVQTYVPTHSRGGSGGGSGAGGHFNIKEWK